MPGARGSSRGMPGGAPKPRGRARMPGGAVADTGRGLAPHTGIVAKTGRYVDGANCRLLYASGCVISERGDVSGINDWHGRGEFATGLCIA
mmetsp:Transcript_89893/g.254752  ORF Transcript_89893/g.254752 Transcript_89893/m.254752 type:complete len:91 (-) Transcript_89893:98-370(-)